MKNALQIRSMLFLVLSLSAFEVSAWTISMNFDDGPLGAKVEDAGNGYPVFSDAAGRTVYSDCDGNSLGSQCAQMNIQKGDDGWALWGGRVTFSDNGVSNPALGDEVWASLKVFMPIGFDYTASPTLKFMRLHSTRSGGVNEGFNDWYITPDGPNHWDPVIKSQTDAPYFFVKELQNKLRFFGDMKSDKPKLGTWETYEMYLRLDSVSVKDGGTARVRFWKNGKLLADIDDIRTLDTKASYSDSFLVFTYWNGGNPKGTGSHPTKSQSLYVDDLIITTDRPANKDTKGNPMIGDIVGSIKKAELSSRPVAPGVMSISKK